jgi:hypothetical protein
LMRSVCRSQAQARGRVVADACHQLVKRCSSWLGSSHQVGASRFGITAVASTAHAALQLAGGAQRGGVNTQASICSPQWRNTASATGAAGPARRCRSGAPPPAPAFRGRGGGQARRPPRPGESRGLAASICAPTFRPPCDVLTRLVT